MHGLTPRAGVLCQPSTHTHRQEGLPLCLALASISRRLAPCRQFLVGYRGPTHPHHTTPTPPKGAQGKQQQQEHGSAAGDEEVDGGVDMGPGAATAAAASVRICAHSASSLSGGSRSSSCCCWAAGHSDDGDADADPGAAAEAARPVPGASIDLDRIDAFFPCSVGGSVSRPSLPLAYCCLIDRSIDRPIPPSLPPIIRSHSPYRRTRAPSPTSRRSPTT